MSVPIFVDTNVFVYAMDDADPGKRDAAQRWRKALWQSREGRTSIQVLQEFYMQASRKWPSARAEIRAEVLDLLAWQPVLIDGSTGAGMEDPGPIPTFVLGCSHRGRREVRELRVSADGRSAG